MFKRNYTHLHTHTALLWPWCVTASWSPPWFSPSPNHNICYSGFAESFSRLPGRTEMSPSIPTATSYWTLWPVVFIEPYFLPFLLFIISSSFFLDLISFPFSLDFISSLFSLDPFPPLLLGPYPLPFLLDLISSPYYRTEPGLCLSTDQSSHKSTSLNLNLKKCKI